MEEYDFELFTGQGGRYNVAISISKPGIISFSSGMHHKYELSKYQGAQLFFDKLKNVIALKLFTEETDNMSKINHRNNNKGSFIACKSFIDASGIDNYLGKRFAPEEIDHPELGKIMIINLNKEIPSK